MTPPSRARFLANYTIMPTGRVMTNHIISIDEEQRLTDIAAANHELAYTTYVPHPLLLISADRTETAAAMIQQARDINTLCQLLAGSRMPMVEARQRVALYEIDFAAKRCRRLV